jgi:signal peptidase I
MNFRWFFSKTVRDAVAVRKHYRRLLAAQRDLLSPQAIGAVTAALNELDAAIAHEHKGKIRIRAEELQFAAEKWLKPYPNPAWRENVEVLLVALAVAMGIRTFFLQPFKIPTGSMQPTLYGVTAIPDFSRATMDAENDARLAASGYAATDAEKARIGAEVNQQLALQKSLVIPGPWERFQQWFHGISYVHFVAPEDGSVEAVTKPWPRAVFSLYQRIKFAGQWHTIWFPPDYGESPLAYRAGLKFAAGHVYHKGEDVVKLEVHAGDHLFVDRLTYNFRPPKRGEIVVFQTEEIPEDMRDRYGIPADEFYIKRLVGLGGETISLKQDYEVADVPTLGGATVPVGHLIVNGHALSASTPHFENLYGFAGVTEGTKTLQYQPNRYYGHAMIQLLSPDQQFQIRPDYLFVMGDNTMNSLDSRYWGDFPASSVIGKAFFVYWPLTDRFGWGNR